MKKNFSISSVAQKVQIVSAKFENSAILKIADREVKCCEWCVGIVGNVIAQKSLILR